MNVADILAEVGGDGVNPSIQSPPLGFKPRVTGDDVVDAYTRQVTRVIAHLVELERRTGRTVTLALEPEPHCFLETTDEAIDYFTNHLYADANTESLAGQTGLSTADAAAALRKHLGMVFDICHQAVEYEDIGACLQNLADADIPVFKLQEAAAVMVPEVTQDAVDALKAYADSVYLTQTVERKDGRITRFLNLEDAFEAWGKGSGTARVAHPFPRAGVPGGPRRFQDHAFRHRGRAGVPQEEQAVAAARDRDLYLGRAARPPEDRRHCRLRDARARMGQGRAGLIFFHERGNRTGPLPHPTTHRILALGGRVGERAGAAHVRTEKREGRS